MTLSYRNRLLGMFAGLLMAAAILITFAVTVGKIGPAEIAGALVGCAYTASATGIRNAVRELNKYIAAWNAQQKGT